jgi:hypothetical protein
LFIKKPILLLVLAPKSRSVGCSQPIPAGITQIPSLTKPLHPQTEIKKRAKKGIETRLVVEEVTAAPEVNAPRGDTTPRCRPWKLLN